MKNVYNYLNNLLINETIVIAVSGGPDSMALFDMLVKIKNNKDIKIVCAHVNHKVREESDDEEIFVRDYCKKNDVVFELLTINDYTGINFENEARKKRYDFFESCIKKYNAKYLFTAHHGDDLIETILMRLVRGSSIRGYSGFSSIVDMNNYKIIRPFITVTKEDIIKYNNENNILYVTDKTNFMNIHTRNRYRMGILPNLKKEDANVHLKFLKFSNMMSMYEDFLNVNLDEKINDIYFDNKINISEFKKIHKLLQIKLLNNVFDELYKDDITLITDKHTNLVMNIIYSNNPNGLVCLPNGKYAVRSYDFIYFKDKKNDLIDYELELSNNIILPSGSIKFIDNTNKSKSNYVCRLLSSELKLPLYVRNRRNGDKIFVKNSGVKKISDIFINEKISKDIRDNTPVVVDSNNEILWLPGIKKSKFDKKNDEKYDIILKYELEEK